MRTDTLIVTLIVPGRAGWLLACTAAGAAQPRADAERIEQRIQTFAQFDGDRSPGVTRLAYSDADITARQHLKALMQELGLATRTDTAGNMFGRRAGRDADAPSILIGSHLDTVPEGGRYDGTAGVLVALEVIELLEAHDIRTHHPVEVVNFAAEEAGLIGSKAFAGILDAESLAETAQAGMSIRRGIERIGGDPAHLERAQAGPDDYKAYIELHVEQGPVLDEAGLDLGVVQGIVGIRWWQIEVVGEANHAGTTPMDRRKDALIGASRLVLAVNEVIRAEPGGQVGTVGRLRAYPGAPNVVPGRVEASLEIRDLSRARIVSLFESIQAQARNVARATDTTIRFRPSPIREEPAATHPAIRDALAAAADARGYTYKRMPSRAGHDAQAVAHVAPIGMIFAPSTGGFSHSPREHTSAADLAKAANVLLDAVLEIDADRIEPQ